MFKFKKRKVSDSFGASIKLTEALVPGSKYKCDILYSGITATANTFANVHGSQVPVYKNYTEQACIEAVNNKIFEGVPALLRSENAHLSAENTGVDSQVGWFSEVFWDPVKKCISGIFNVKSGEGLADSFKQSLAELFSAGKELGLSIVAWGDWLIESIGDKCVATVTKITSAQSVDPVAAGNAGGKIIHLVESLNSSINFSNNNLTGDIMNPELKTKIFELCMSAMLIAEGVTVESVDDDDLLNTFYQYCYTLMYSPTLTESTKKSLTEIKTGLEDGSKTLNPVLAELLKKEVTAAPPAPTPPPAPNGQGNLSESQQAAQSILDRAEILACNTVLNNRLTECTLPTPMKDLIKNRYLGKKFAEADLEKDIKDSQRVLAELNPTPVNNRGLDIRIGQDASEKYGLQLQYMLMPWYHKEKLTEAERKVFKDAGVDETMYSIKEWYRGFTGDLNVTGQNKGGGVLSESIVTTGFTNVLASTLHRIAVTEYRIMVAYESWRKVCSQIGPVTDFRNNERVRWGGYGNLPTVAQGGTYNALSTPSDEKASFAATKKGGTEDITLEVIKNDDVGFVASIAPRLGRAAKITLYEFVWNLIISNPAIYDTKNLFHADHANLLNVALSDTSYIQARNLMVSQTEKNSGKKLGLAPKYLIVAMGSLNEKEAYNLTTAAWNKANDKSDFHQTFGVEPIPVAHQADTNDWQLVADPMMTPTIEMGFLDNQQEPEIFTQDMPNVGSFFTNDKITLKIRHIYGGDVLDYRGFVGSVVAGG